MSRRSDTAIEVISFVLFAISLLATIVFWVVAAVFLHGEQGHQYVHAGWLCLIPMIIFGMICGVIG